MDSVKHASRMLLLSDHIYFLPEKPLILSKILVSKLDLIVPAVLLLSSLFYFISINLAYFV